MNLMTAYSTTPHFAPEYFLPMQHIYVPAWLIRRKLHAERTVFPKISLPSLFTALPVILSPRTPRLLCWTLLTFFSVLEELIQSKNVQQRSLGVL